MPKKVVPRDKLIEKLNIAVDSLDTSNLDYQLALSTGLARRDECSFLLLEDRYFKIEDKVIRLTKQLLTALQGATITWEK